MKKSLRPIILVFAFLMTGFTSHTIAQNSFHAKVNQIDEVTYELDLALGVMIAQTELIEIDILDEYGMTITTFAGSVQGENNQYQIFLNNEFQSFSDGQTVVNLTDEMLGSTKAVSIVIRLMKDDFTVFNTITSQVTN